MEADPEIAVVVVDRRQPPADLDVGAEFLPDLPPQGGGGVLARFDLAPGELPQPAHPLVRRALRHQEQAVLAHDHGAHDIDGGGTGHQRAGVVM